MEQKPINIFFVLAFISNPAVKISSMTDDRGQRSEVRSQRSEVRGQMTDVRLQRSEVRGQRSEVRRQTVGVRCQFLTLPIIHTKPH
jgi:hypothetical protein